MFLIILLIIVVDMLLLYTFVYQYCYYYHSVKLVTILGRAVVGHEGLVLGVLLLAELGRLRDVLVQRRDAGLQRGDLLGHGRDGLRPYICIHLYTIYY